MSQASINLEGIVNIAKVESLHHELEEVLKLATPIKISASNVSRVDTAALQLLSSFFKSMHSAGTEVTWDGVSDELVAAAKLLGLIQSLKLSLSE